MTTTAYGIRADGRMVIRRATGTYQLLGIRATRNGHGRWQYKSVATGKMVASGMEPGAFIASYWYASPDAYDPRLGFEPGAEALQ